MYNCYRESPPNLLQKDTRWNHAATLTMRMNMDRICLRVSCGAVSAMWSTSALQILCALRDRQCVREWPFTCVSLRMSLRSSSDHNGENHTYANAEVRAYEHGVVASFKQLWQRRLYSKFFEKGCNLHNLRRLLGRQRLLVRLCESF